MYQESSLLNLPAELRDEIYSLALSSDTPIVIPTSGKLARPALLRARKQVTSKAAIVYYSVNAFHEVIAQGSITGPEKWLQAIGKANASNITSLLIKFDMSEKLKDPSFKHKGFSLKGESFGLGNDPHVSPSECWKPE